MGKTDKSAEDIISTLIVCGYADHGEYLYDAGKVKEAMHEYSAQQLSEYKEVIKELLPLAQNFASTLRWDEEYSGDEVGGKEAQEIVDRAKKLIEK